MDWNGNISHHVTCANLNVLYLSCCKKKECWFYKIKKILDFQKRLIPSFEYPSAQPHVSILINWTSTVFIFSSQNSILICKNKEDYIYPSGMKERIRYHTSPVNGYLRQQTKESSFPVILNFGILYLLLSFWIVSGTMTNSTGFFTIFSAYFSYSKMRLEKPTKTISL